MIRNSIIALTLFILTFVILFNKTPASAYDCQWRCSSGNCIRSFEALPGDCNIYGPTPFSTKASCQASCPF